MPADPDNQPVPEPQQEKDTKEANPKPKAGAGQGYVSVRPDPMSARTIQRWLRRIGVVDGESRKDMHVTLMYDRRNKRFDVQRRRGALYSARIKTIELLGGENGPQAMALTLESQQLDKRFAELKLAGYKHSYPRFKAHLTIKNAPSDSDFLLALTNLDSLWTMLPTLTLYREEWKAVHKTAGRKVKTKVKPKPRPRTVKAVPKAATV